MKKIEFTKEQIADYLKSKNRHGRHGLKLIKFRKMVPECVLYVNHFNGTVAAYLLSMCEYFECRFYIASCEKLYTICLFKDEINIPSKSN